MNSNRILVNASSKKMITTNMNIAETYYKRFIGLMGKNNIDDDYCLLLKPCNQIHMFFMKFSIDAVYVDKDLRVCGIDTFLKPWKVGKKRSDAIMVLEFKAGFTKNKIHINDIIRVD